MIWRSYGKSVIALFYLHAVAKRFGRVLFHYENDGSVASLHVDTAGVFIRENPHIPENPYTIPSCWTKTTVSCWWEIHQEVRR